jgi:RNA polymerase sigma-70 factor (ECF subfamily)
VLSLAEVFEQYATSVERWAARLGGTRVDSDDVVQEVFLVVQKRLPAFRPTTATLSTWLYQITLNVVRGQRRRSWWRRVAGTDVDEQSAEDERAGPGARLENKQEAQRVYAVLDQLKERSRTVLVMFEMEQMSGEEIAQVLNAKVGTVWVWLNRARAEFMARMLEMEAAEK